MSKATFLLFFSGLALLLLLGQCRPATPTRQEKTPDEPPAPHRLSFSGKIRNHPIQEDIYQRIPFDSLPPPFISNELIEALESQYQLLDYSRTKRHRLTPELTVDQADLYRTVSTLLERKHTYTFGLADKLELYRLQGRDQRANVLFTGYYSPVVKVSERPSARYRFPIYRRPRDWEGPFPTRRQIEAEGALDSLDLIIGWTDDKFDVYLMQIQGSGYVEYPNGTTAFFAYDGTNRHSYRSMERYLRSWDGPQPQLYTLNGVKAFFREYPELVDTILYQNPSYTFFKPSRGRPWGAGSVPLTAEISIAVDRRYIPLGSCLLAAVPVYDPKKKRVTRHEYRILLAQDVGGAIRGPGHVDLYVGAGEAASQRANSLRQYGQLYLILPRKVASKGQIPSSSR